MAHTVVCCCSTVLLVEQQNLGPLNRQAFIFVLFKREADVTQAGNSTEKRNSA